MNHKKIIVFLVMLFITITSCSFDLTEESDVPDLRLISNNDTNIVNLDTDYLSIMMDAATKGDYLIGVWAENQRRIKAEVLNLEIIDIDFDSLLLLSKVITMEAGSDWLSNQHKMAVGEVLLNRVISSEFPNTLRECFFESSQYQDSNSKRFRLTLPQLKNVKLALRLLQGERHLPSSAVFQGTTIQGPIVAKFPDIFYNTTYICLSNNFELYNH